MVRLISHAGVRVLMAIVAGILAGRVRTLPVDALLLATSAAWTAACVAQIAAWRHARWRLARTAAVFLLCFLTGMTLIRVADREIDTTLLAYADGNIPTTFTGTVASDPIDNGRTVTFRFRCDSVIRSTRADRVSAATTVTVFGRNAEAPVRLPSAGDRLRLRGTLTTPRPLRNPGGFDARAYALQQGITTQLRVKSPDALVITGEAGEFRATALFASVRRDLFAQLDSVFAREDSDLLRGLLFGDRSRIDRDVSRDFRDSGVIHILSVSGTHVGILLAILWLLLGRIPMTFRVAIALGTLWGYAFLTDLSPPVLRSVVMATMFLLAVPLQRITSAINTWALSGIVLLVLSPRDLFSPSFQLSFSAVLSILLFHQRIVTYAQRTFPRLMSRFLVRQVVVLSAMTCTAQLGTFPFLVMYFRQISIVSFAANLFIVPLTSFVMATSLPAMLFSYVGAFPAVQLAEAAHASLAVVVSLSTFFARVPFAVVSVQSMPVWGAVLYATGMFWMHGVRRRVRYRLCIGMFAASASVLWMLAVDVPADRRGQLRIMALDVSQGDAILIRSPDGKVMLIDAGASSDTGDEGERTVIPALRSLGIDTLHVLLITHFDDDHAGGAGSVLRQIPVGMIATPAPRDGDTTASRLLDDARRRRIPWLAMQRGMEIRVSSDVRCDVLAPAPGEARGANEQSVVTLLRYGMTQVLCSGDAPVDVENDIVRAYGPILRANLYKVGHHGSRTSTGTALLDAVKPSISIISCGRHNRFKHPSPAVVRSLVHSGSRVYRTDVSGALLFVSDGRRLWHEEWR